MRVEGHKIEVSQVGGKGERKLLWIEAIAQWGRAFVLHAGSIPSIEYGPWSLLGVTSEHRDRNNP